MQIIEIENLPFFQNKKIKSFSLLKNQGYNNINYLVKTSKKNYVLRIFNSKDNLNRELEYKIQKKAFLKNISAKPYYFEKNNYLIYKYIKGKHKTKLKKADLKLLIKSIRKLHQISIKKSSYNLKNLANIFENYRLFLKDKKTNKQILKAKKQIKKLKKYTFWESLCHHDLNPKNIIFQRKKVIFIDWEYARLDDIFFDLASLCVEFKLSKKKQIYLLNLYFKNLEKEHLKKLALYKLIYKLLCKLWFKKEKVVQ
ncbi:phosphotransferase [Malaciobacter mytili]|uniref:phosphotransferase n=1 Tax=Malaciobacter mytili TaxID=603050 RepID=UPI003A8868B4